MWGYAKIMKIMSTKKYKQMLLDYNGLIGQIKKSIKVIDQLEAENAELKKQLLYQKTYNDTFKRKLDEIIFPNTDERGLGEQEIPVNFPDLW